ncbi:MAG: T9SS type A sorting domain-containing protein, partial [Bacteroidota bacterium]
NLLGNFNLVDSMYHGIYEPQRITVASRDINGDGIREILTGNYAGGLTMYAFDSTTSVQETIQREANFQLFPNPASDYIMIRIDETAPPAVRDIRIVDITGREVLKVQSSAATVPLQLGSVSSGIYRCIVSDGRVSSSKNFVIAKP